MAPASHFKIGHFSIGFLRGSPVLCTHPLAIYLLKNGCIIIFHNQIWKNYVVEYQCYEENGHIKDFMTNLNERTFARLGNGALGIKLTNARLDMVLSVLTNMHTTSTAHSRF